MTIRSLTLTNFRSFESRTIDLGGRTLILGPLASGKSSIYDAIRWLLTGVCRGLDAAGKGADRLIRTGESQATVTATIEHKGKTATVTRSVRAGAGTELRTDVFQGSSSDQQKALYGWLGMSSLELLAALDSDVFLELGHVQAKTLLMGLLNVHVTVNDETLSLDELERRYEAAFERRRTLKAILATLPALPAPAEPPQDADEIRSKLTALRTELDEKKAVIAARSGALTERRKSFEQLLAKLDEKRPERTATELWQRVTEAEQTRERAHQDLKEHDALVARETPTESAIDPARVAALEQFNPKNGCVLGGGVACPAKRSVFQAAARTLSETLAADTEAAKARDAVKERRAVLANSLETIAREQAALREAHTYAVTWEQEHARVVALLAEIPDAPEAAADDDLKQTQADIETLTGRIRKGEAVLEKHVRLANEQRAYDARQQEREAHDRDLRTAEFHVEQYGPKGVRVAALGQALADWQGAINGILSPFGYTLAVSVDPWRVDVNGRSWVMLSTSERLRVGIAVQAAVAAASGLGCILIDQVDLLLSNERKLLFDLVMSLPLDQALVARSYEPAAESPASNDRLTVVRLQ